LALHAITHPLGIADCTAGALRITRRKASPPARSLIAPPLLARAGPL
jgi:hypothetical protein